MYTLYAYTLYECNVCYTLVLHNFFFLFFFLEKKNIKFSSRLKNIHKISFIKFLISKKLNLKCSLIEIYEN